MASNILCGQSGLLGLPSVAANDVRSSNGSTINNSGTGDLKTSSTNQSVHQLQRGMTSLADAKLNPYLRVDRKQLKRDVKAGMEVYKISKNGKLQARRLAISPDNRCLLITTNRVKSFKGLFKVATGNGHDPTSTKFIDLSRIDRIIKGQLSKRFLMQYHYSDDHQYHSTTTDQNKNTASIADLLLQKHEATCLTIIYRQTKSERQSMSSSSSSSLIPNSSSTAAGGEEFSYRNLLSTSIASTINMNSSSVEKSKVGGNSGCDVSVSAGGSGSGSGKGSGSGSGKGSNRGSSGGNSTCAYYGGYECLDLCITKERDYDNLVLTLEELIKLYKEERRWMERSVLLFQHHWVDMGKTGSLDPISVGEWVTLCNRLNTPLGKIEVTSLYKDMKNELKRACKDLGTELEFIDVGLPQWTIAELLKDLLFNSAVAMGLKYVKQDPLLRLWHEILESDPVPILNKDGSKDQLDTRLNQSAPDMTISPVALLSFIRSQQKEFRATLEDALNLIQVIQAQRSFKDLASNTADDDNNNHNIGDGNGDDDSNNNHREISTGDGRLTKGEFFNFLLSDANDLMDPQKGKVSADDMNHPLSSYWIMSSHDTYLDCWNQNQPVLDEQMYLAALYRGVKCLELDVWDGFLIGSDSVVEPVIAREKPKLNDPSVDVNVALKAIRQYLLGNKKSYPIILNIENHCSYKVQEKLAQYIFQILGSIGLIVVPDNTESTDASDLLPSPATMRGRVLLMGKRPNIVMDGAKVVNDDFDDENDIIFDDSQGIPNVKTRDEEEYEMEKGTVVGFDIKGPVRVYNETEQKNIIKHSPGELLYIAKQELETAELQAVEVEMKATTLEADAAKADKYADTLIRNSGLADDAVSELLSKLNGKDIDPDQHLDLLSRTQDEGVEIQDFFADAVESAKLTYTEAEQYAFLAAEDANRTLQKLNQATGRLSEAEALLETSYVKGKKVVTKYHKAAKIARDKQEISSYDHRRVEKLRQMLGECETGANSAHNVVNTAMTEAKISEKRASETEARAARAAATAQKDRARAEDETRKEEDLERQAGALHEKLSVIAKKEKQLKVQSEKASLTFDKLNEQIKLIETSSQFQREKREMSGEISEEKKEAVVKSGKVHVKHASKIEERRELRERIDQISSERSLIIKQRIQSQDAFEKKAHQWKGQAEIASKFRKVADKSSHAAEDLAEHAEEEREAANLRRVARDRAESHVTEKDSYKTGLEAQLKEAERATTEADYQADKARKEADRLEKANESYENSGYEDIFSITEKRKDTRADLLADYEERKIIQKTAEDRAAELRKQYETSDNVFMGTVKNAESHAKSADNQRQQDKNALLEVNHARSIRKKAHHVLEEARYAQSVVTEKRCIFKRAEEYKLKTDRVTEIPPQLANMTFLHTTKHKYWDKSLQLPSTHVHSFAEGALEQMTEKNKEEHMQNLKNFTSSHLCRSFRSWKDVGNTSELNTDPLFQWSLGCQLVSLNYSTYDEQLLKADGRFRRNGSCGYTLKPEFLRSYDAVPERPESWKLNVLCGSCFPTPDSKQHTTTGISFINPFVKINVYGGDLEKRTGEHTTCVVEKNGLNPVFDDKTGFIFKATSPSLAILTFTIWHKTEEGTEELICGSAMPVSCIREGCRSVPLFDKQNTRAGAFAYACLLVKAKRVT